MRKFLRTTRKLLRNKYLFIKNSCHDYQWRHFCAVIDKSVNDLPLALGYKPKEVEEAYWAREKECKNKPESSKKKRGAYRMILPPPNVTGNLHLGHALNATIQDVLARQQRLMGYDVLWLPGTDHAGIATQVVVEKKLLHEQGKTRKDIGRDAFLSEVWKWRNEKGAGIIEDLRKLGCILNWENEYFTMDEKISKAVSTAFIRLFEEGIIERRNALVNWSCALESAISDIEVRTMDILEPTECTVPGYKFQVLFGRIYDIAYHIDGTGENGTEPEEIVVTTTRPETILGDVAVAVHPLDERYMKYRNMPEVKLKHPFRNHTIPLIFDLAVDKEFGTGAVKITPAHDKRDFEIAIRHNLEPIKVFTNNGLILSTFEKFRHLPRFDARDEIINCLEEMKLLRHVRGHKMKLPYCTRSMDIIEYMLVPQWFVKTETLAEAALSELHSGRLQIVPNNFEEDWNRWLQNCHDWCISRQLWWGHQVPAYEATDAQGNSCWVAALDAAEAREKALGKLNVKELTSLKRDEDVLDTWFSSALLPFAVQGWPHEKYLEHYPLDIMQTGHDILFFWVARMMMLGLKLTGKAPFKRVVLNGMICDAHGRKMSKSLGNVITPQQVVHGAALDELKAELQKNFDTGLLTDVELRGSIIGLMRMFPNGIPECGTDALRFTLCSHNIKNHFINFDINECHTNKLFMNKIWNAVRFTLTSADKLSMCLKEIETMDNAKFGIWDNWIISRLADTLTVCSDSYDNYNFHMATAALKRYLYQDLCDVYLETTKADIAVKNAKGYMHCATLATCLSWAVQALAPFAPFIASELLQHLPANVQISLSSFQDSKLETEIAEIIRVCESVRQLKSQNKISKKHEPCVYLFAQNADALNILEKHRHEIKVLTRTNAVDIELLNEESKFSKKLNFFSTAGSLCSFGLSTNSTFPTLDSINMVVNRKKLQKLLTELESYRLRMDNDAFRMIATKGIQDHCAKRIKELETEIENLKPLVS